MTGDNTLPTHALSTQPSLADVQAHLNSQPAVQDVWRTELVTLKPYGIKRLRVSTRPRPVDYLLLSVKIIGFVAYMVFTYELWGSLKQSLVLWGFAWVFAWILGVSRVFKSTSYHLYVFEDGFALRQGVWGMWGRWREPTFVDCVWSDVSQVILHGGDAPNTIKFSTLDLVPPVLKCRSLQGAQALTDVLTRLLDAPSPQPQVQQVDGPAMVEPVESWTDDDWS
jgi:hypothetical protein